MVDPTKPGYNKPNQEDNKLNKNSSEIAKDMGLKNLKSYKDI